MNFFCLPLLVFLFRWSWPSVPAEPMPEKGPWPAPLPLPLPLPLPPFPPLAKIDAEELLDRPAAAAAAADAAASSGERKSAVGASFLMLASKLSSRPAARSFKHVCRKKSKCACMDASSLEVAGNVPGTREEDSCVEGNIAQCSRSTFESECDELPSNA